MPLPQSITRETRIRSISSSILNAIIIERPADYKKFIYVICQDYFCTKKLAQEYIKIAMMQSNTKLENGLIVKNA